MNIFEKILVALDGNMTTPTNYGWFHLMFVGIAIATTILLCCLYRNCSDKTFRRIALIGWVVIVVLEIYKQLNFSYTFDREVGYHWTYQWYAFPFQFCSTPLYILPFVIFLKEGKVRDVFVMFMIVFSFFGGLVVFIYPNDVFISTIGINIQTMIHHGLQVVFGIYFAVYYRKKLSWTLWAKSILVFVGCITVAMILNVSVAPLISDTFNMFYISPFHECTLPILSMVYTMVPYPVFFLVYVLGFVLVSAILFSIFWLIIKLVTRGRKKETNEKLA